jgi:hypothetical protein
MLHTGPRSCRGVRLNNTYTNFEHIYNPIWWDHESPSSSPSTCRSWSPPFVNDFHPNIEVTLDQKTFISALVRSPRISSNGLSNMVYELLQHYFVPDDFASDFDLFFKVCGHIIQGHVPPLVSCLFFASQLLALKK